MWIDIKVAIGQLLYYIDCIIRHLQEHAFETSQKYKEGKYIIELVHMIKDNGWED